MSDLDKVKYFNKYIMDNVEYVVKSEYNQDVRSAFINKETVCAGYTKMFKVLCNYSGINCIFIGGEVKDYEDDKRLLVWGESEGHAWNVVQIDGKYYWADITANDCISSNEFLMCSNDFFLKTHVMSDEYLAEQVRLSEETK